MARVSKLGKPLNQSAMRQSAGSKTTNSTSGMRRARARYIPRKRCLAPEGLSLKQVALRATRKLSRHSVRVFGKPERLKLTHDNDVIQDRADGRRKVLF